MNPTCKVTGALGRKVPEATLTHLLRDEVLPLAEGRGWFFCPDPDCAVVYFSEEGETLSKDALTVRVGIKEKAAPRPLCYCFDHSIEDIERDVARSGDSPIPDLITDKCRQGLDRCEETNPQGSCCLGNVRRVLKDAQARRAAGSATERNYGEEAHDCCKAPMKRETP
jgi:hypothetical protein